MRTAVFRTRWLRFFSAAGVVTAALFLFSGPAQALTVLVDNDGNNTITQYDFDTGAYQGFFTTYSMQRPYVMAADSAHNVYVSDIAANTIEKFSLNGAHLATFTNVVDNEGIVVSGGYLYSTSYANGTIEKFALNGTDLGVFATVDNKGLEGITADASGNLYVADYNGTSHGGTIQKIAPGGTVSQFATMAATPYGLTVDSSGNIYGSDPIYNHVLHKFAPDGTDLGVIVSGITALYMTTGTNNFIYAPLRDTPAIEMYSTNGTDLGTFTTTGLNSPVGVLIIPEPSSFLLLAAGAAVLVGVRRRKH